MDGRAGAGGGHNVSRLHGWRWGAGAEEGEGARGKGRHSSPNMMQPGCRACKGVLADGWGVGTGQVMVSGKETHCIEGSNSGGVWGHGHQRTPMWPPMRSHQDLIISTQASQHPCPTLPSIPSPAPHTPALTCACIGALLTEGKVWSRHGGNAAKAAPFTSLCTQT